MLISITFCIFPALCLALIGENVCWDTWARKTYCCSDFEEVNNSCIECNTGFTSRRGRPCTLCDRNMYGKRCLSECNCPASQRCDSVIGCVDINTSMILVSTDLKKEPYHTTEYSVFGSTSNKADDKHGTDLHTEELPSTEKIVLRNTTSKTDDTQAMSSKYLLRYSIPATCVVILLGISFLLYIWKTKAYSFEKIRVNTEGDINVNENVEPDDIIYHEINDEDLVDIYNKNTTETIYLEVINDSLYPSEPTGLEQSFLHVFQAECKSLKFEKQEDAGETLAACDERSCLDSDNFLERIQADPYSIANFNIYNHKLSSSDSDYDLSDDDCYKNPYQMLQTKADIHEYEKIEHVFIDDISNATNNEANTADVGIEKMSNIACISDNKAPTAALKVDYTPEIHRPTGLSDDTVDGVN